jgi:hypothetical protein
MIVTFLGIFGLAVYALVAGNPDKFIAPYDATGQLCGFKNELGLKKDLTEFPYLYFTKMPVPNEKVEEGFVTKVMASGVCVKECPDATKIADSSFWTNDCKSAIGKAPTSDGEIDVKVDCPTASTGPPNYAS